MDRKQKTVGGINLFGLSCLKKGGYFILLAARGGFLITPLGLELALIPLLGCQ
jgi:hypothetical protein